MISREDAAKVAESLEPEGAKFPFEGNQDWSDGWSAACETIALSLRIKGCADEIE